MSAGDKRRQTMMESAPRSIGGRRHARKIARDPLLSISGERRHLRHSARRDRHRDRSDGRRLMLGKDHAVSARTYRPAVASAGVAGPGSCGPGRTRTADRGGLGRPRQSSGHPAPAGFGERHDHGCPAEPHANGKAYSTKSASRGPSVMVPRYTRWVMSPLLVPVMGIFFSSPVVFT